jgi:hypothetical protein
MADRRLEATGVALVALVGGFVWLTRHPEAAIVDRAASWPVVGGAARAFRDRWRPAPPPPPPPAADPEMEYVYRIESDGPSPGRPALQWPPRASAAATSEVRRFASRDATEPVGPLPGRAADPFRLERARGLLGAGARAVPLGPYTLWSDLDEPDLAPLAARWRALAEGADAAWRARYGVAPAGGAAETIVLFARAAAFEAYVAAEPTLAGSGAHGVAGWGLVALAAEGRAAAELDGVFAHELAHLLTRRSIGPALPPWLAEGLAEDFGHAPWIDGAPRFDRARGEVRRDGLRFELRGGVAVVDLAGRRAAAGELPDLAALAAFDEGEFGDGAAGVDRYGDAFVWLRFLLAEPARAAAFRAFLAEIRAGGPPELAALERRLGAPAAALAAPLVAWLLPWRAAELARHGAPAALPDREGRVAASPAAAPLPPEG